MARYVDLDKVLELVNEVNEDGNFTSYAHYSYLFDSIDKLPTIEQPKRNNGKWLVDEDRATGDTIYRQAAIDAHCELCPDKYICCPVRSGNICHEFEVFRLLPPAQRKTGKWVSNGVEAFGVVEYWVCDQCHDQSKYRTNYCPSCGAYMGSWKK